ncbi:helix-turn-helix transcriptional regulator [Bacillus infantis]|uniref:helix-turn-helix transcriptional regulator n=1 Tax=Bacillus infantis TaxID=324767 RepID=UPI003CF26445
MRNIVKYLRRSQQFDMTQQELANIVGVSKVTISTIEKGGNTSGEIMLRISEVFNKDPREIFFIDDVNFKITKSQRESVES